MAARFSTNARRIAACSGNAGWATWLDRPPDSPAEIAHPRGAPPTGGTRTGHVRPTYPSCLASPDSPFVRLRYMHIFTYNFCMPKARKPPNRAKEPYAFWISPDQKAGLRAIRERDGIPVSEQIRRAIDRWLEEKATEQAAPRRGATRPRT